MLSFTKLAVLALPLFGAVIADEPARDVSQTNSIYSSAHEAFQDLLNALPEDSLKAALSGLKDFKNGVFESHHRGVEQVHNTNPALATKLIVAAVQDLKKRQNPSNGTTSAAPPPPPQSSPQNTPAQSPSPSPQQSPSQQQPNSPAAPTTVTTTTDRAVIVNVPQTTTNAAGSTIVTTTSVLSVATASVPVTRTLVSAGSTIVTTQLAPAVIRTTTDSRGSTATITSAAQFAPTAGEVRTETDAAGSTFVTTYTPGGGKISSVRLITTTDAQGRPSTMTSYTFVDPAAETAPAEPSRTQGGRPGLQTGAAAVNGVGLGWMALGGAVVMFV
jgi:hypothetical protein